MAHLDVQQSSDEANIFTQSSQPLQKDLSDSHHGFESDETVEKDETELELEKLVFGDDAGFRAALNADRRDTFSKKSSEKAAEALYDEVETVSEDGFNEVDDADVRLNYHFHKVFNC